MFVTHRICIYLYMFGLNSVFCQFFFYPFFFCLHNFGLVKAIDYIGCKISSDKSSDKCVIQYKGQFGKVQH